MNQADEKWQRLLKRAKLGDAPPADGEPDSAWVTRTAARALAARSETGGWELRFAWQALGVAAVITVVALGANFRQWSDWVEDEAAAIENLSTAADEADLS
ncbi:hypothetical protein [Nibricoccus sp. IMCC34717]|uniref:hypothetical protein n=1 Tax=Nibricoccus sp. IMCC34717 TaxID=3034021 RepID=UPI00384B3684